MKLVKNFFIDIKSKTIRKDIPYYIVDVLKNKSNRIIIKKSFNLLLKDDLEEHKKYELIKYMCDKNVFFLENRLDILNYITVYPNIKLVKYLIEKDFLGHRKINSEYKKQIKIIGSFGGDSVGFKISPDSIYKRLGDSSSILDDIVDFQNILIKKDLSYNQELVRCLQLIFDRVEVIFNDELRKNCLLWSSYKRPDGKGLGFRIKNKYCNIPLDKKSQENFILSIMSCNVMKNNSSKVVL